MLCGNFSPATGAAMASPLPVFANERNAAKLLDMRPGEFRALVEAGALPGPTLIGEEERWDTELLVKAIRGEGPEERPRW